MMHRIAFHPRRHLRIAACLLGVACAENISDDVSGPKLLASDGSMPVLRTGGSIPIVVAQGIAPPIPAEWKGYAAVKMVPNSATQSVASAGGRTPAPHFVHAILENTTTGAHAIWVISIGSIVNSASLGTMPTTWRVTGSGDFNADNLEDILWENTADGTRAVWLMDGNGGVTGVVNFGVVPLTWHMAGAGDYNGDGKEDILRENADGSRALWFMNGGRVVSTVSLGTLDPAWTMTAANDFDSDGRDDILLENTTTNSRVLWTMNGAGVVTSGIQLGALTGDWKFAATGDIDGDYHDDIHLDNNVNGTRAAWMEGGFGGVISAPVLTTLDPNWRIATSLVPNRGDKTGVWSALSYQSAPALLNCALRTGGVAYCWGSNANAELGTNNTTLTGWPFPLPVSTRVRFAKLTAGTAHACGIDLAGAAWCWGNDKFVSNTGNAARIPTAVPMPAGVEFTQIATYEHHTCAVSTVGEAYCWGRNLTGELGTGDTRQHLTPTLVLGDLNFTFVATGLRQTCGVTTNGEAYCWGEGDGFRPNTTVPVQIPLPPGVTEISVAANHTCAVVGGGDVYCWGNNDDGQLGGSLGDPTHPPPPGTNLAQPRSATRDSTAAYAHVVTGIGPITDQRLATGNFTCATTVAGGARCWGDPSFGIWGNGSTDGRTANRGVTRPLGVFYASVTASYGAACVRTTTSAIYCWGRDAEGKLGLGNGTSATDVTVPTLVVPPQVVAAR